MDMAYTRTPTITRRHLVMDAVLCVCATWLPTLTSQTTYVHTKQIHMHVRSCVIMHTVHTVHKVHTQYTQ